MIQEVKSFSKKELKVGMVVQLRYGGMFDEFINKLK